MLSSASFARLAALAAILIPFATLAGSPIATEVQPSGANIGGGSTVVVFGPNIGVDIETTTVTIGGVNAPIIASSTNDIEVTVPPRANAGVVAVVVHRIKGPVPISDAFVYRHDYRAGRDFAHTTNPNGPWSYGVSASRLAPVSLTSDPPTRYGCVHSWSDASGSTVARNRNSTLCGNIATWQWPAGRIGGHPASSGANAVVRFVVPATTTYHIAGDFTGADPAGPTTSDGAVLHNGVELMSAFVGYNVAQNFDLRLDLVAGDTLDFKVGNGGNGYAYDQTTMQITISGDVLHVDGFE